MSKTVVYTVHVEFGDCDPARIVWFPNFFAGSMRLLAIFLSNVACRPGMRQRKPWA